MMEGRVKTRQPGVIPNSLGKQVGVLPISGRSKPRRTNSEKNGSIPIGGTDIISTPESYQARPPVSSSSSTSGRTRTSAKSQAERRTNSTSSLHNQQGSTSSRSNLNEDSSIETTTLGSSRTSPASKNLASASSSRLTSSTRTRTVKTSPVGSRTATGTSRTSPAASHGQSKHSPTSPAVSKLDLHTEGDIDDDQPLEQDVLFTNVPSQRSRPGSGSRPGSKVKRSPGSAHGSQSQREQENGKKPYKTIDPEEVLAQNMESDYNKIYEINLHACEITHLDHMEKFRKVKVLDLACNFIEQIQNLELNKDLRELKLYDNRLRKIDCLENLKDLSSLQLQHNKIKSIGKSLGTLKKLKNLRIDCNQLLKIETSELSQCVQLTVLDISYNMLDSLAALNYLPNLEEVNASGNRMRSVSDLSKCKRLQEIDLSGNRIIDLSGLRGLPKLMTLNISNNQLKSLKSMGRLRSLQDLHVSNNHIHELSTVATQLPVLEVLDLVDNEITDWDEFYYLEEMRELVELFISGNPFCSQDGVMPHYFSAIQAVLPDLEIIDGAHIKKHVAKGAPLMRPMSASSVVSLRQMDCQMKSSDEQMMSLEKSLEQKFAALRSNCDSLPAESPSARLFSPHSNDTTPMSSRCSSRSRILDARKFAATNKK